MSLDFYLDQPGAPVRASTGIFIRENGSTRELTREEWDERFPDREPVVFTGGSGRVFSANVTHNLGEMADAAGIYDCLWRPDEHGMTRAGDIVGPLSKGLAELKSDPKRFKAFDPPNGWGDYDGLVEFAESVLDACMQFPDAQVGVSR